MSSWVKQQQFQSKFLNQDKFDPSKREQHSLFGFLTGYIKNPKACQSFQIDDPNCQVLLQHATFYTKDSQECFRQRTVQLFFKEDFSSEDLEIAINNYTKIREEGDAQLQQHLSNAKKNQKEFSKIYNVSKNIAYGCCLAISYYTGIQSQRINRDTNIQLRFNSLAIPSKIQKHQKYKYLKCISYWLYKALQFIPLYWGKVTRCINLNQEQQKMYKVGNIATWIQFSSSSHGQITEYFAKRNTRFIIYSLSGRSIERFSNYGKSQSQVLFKPYTHFLVLKNQKKDGKLYIYMREIFLGQSLKNVLWVDDNIFDSKWQNKKLMESALIKNPFLGIIPKVSTETAMAYIKCQCGKQKSEKQFRIISDMTRKNQTYSQKAGAIFLKQIEPYYNNIKTLIFTSNEQKARKFIKQMNVKLLNYNVTIKSQDALNFLNF